MSLFSLVFDGVNDFVQLDAAPIPSGDFSVGFWIKSVVGSLMLVFSQHPSGEIQVRVSFSGKIEASVDGNNLITGATTLVTGTWYHVLLVSTSGAQTIYLNGVSDATGSQTPNYLSQPGRWGTGTGSDNFLAGSLADCFVLLATLTPTQASQLAAGTLSPSTFTYSGGGGHWPFTEGTGITTADASGNNNNGTLENGVLWSSDIPPELNPAPVADFTGTPTSGTSPLSVVFTDTSTGTPTSWLWEKNSGSGWVNFAGTPTAQNPTESFATGTWSVRLTATNTSGSDTKTRTDYITATQPVPVVDFTATPTSGPPPLTVAFTDTSTNTPTSWAWTKNDNIGGGWVPFDGTPTAQNPVEIFTAGVWSINLAATNAGGTGHAERDNYINAQAGSFPLGRRGPVCTVQTLFQRA